MTDEALVVSQTHDRPLPFAIKATGLLMVAGAIWKIVTLLIQSSQVNLFVIMLVALWGIIGVCGVGVLLRSDAARISGGILLNLTALLYFAGLAMYIAAIFLASFGNNRPGSATGQFLSLLFTPLIALVCAKLILGAGSIARTKSADSTTPP